MTEPHFALGYARMSKLAQVASVPAQLAKIEQYYGTNAAFAEGFQFVGPFVDEGVSATRTKLLEREAGGALDQAARKGDHVLLALGDRAFRSAADCINTIDIWHRRGITVHLCNIGLDTSSYVGRFVVQILGSLAEMEGELRAERVAAAQQALRQQGKPAVTDYTTPWGWKVVRYGTHLKQRRYEENWQERALCLEIQILKGKRTHRGKDQQGMSWPDLCEHFNARGGYVRFGKHHNWTVATLRRAKQAADNGFPPPYSHRDDVDLEEAFGWTGPTKQK